MADANLTVPSGYDTTGIEQFRLASFAFHSGETRAIHLAYREFNRGASKTVLLPTCYGGRINETHRFATGCLADRHVVVVAMLGNGESASPSNTPGFPESLDYRDCVNAQYRLLTEHLAVKHVESVIGFSMGGQQAYYWAKMYPDYISSAVSICSSASTSAHNYAFLAGAEAALIHSVDYPRYLQTGERPVKGLAAMGRTWSAWGRSAAWYRTGEWKKTAPTIDEYLTKTANTGFLDWDANDLMIGLRMWQKSDMGSFRADASQEQSLAEIKVPVLAMPCRTDTYFSWEDNEHEVSFLNKPSRIEIIESIWGHVAGAGLNEEDNKWMDQRIGAWLREIGGAGKP